MQEVDPIIQFTQEPKAENQRLGFDRLGIAPAAPPPTARRLCALLPSGTSVSYPTFWDHLSRLAQ